MKYDVFISYSRADYLDNNNNVISDSPLVCILDTLERNEISYWLDIDGNNAVNQYMSKIAKAINSSSYILFISSQKSNHIDSYWPVKEILLACEKHKKILPLKIDNSEYHEDLILALAGLDIFEYYKNPSQSLKKLIKVLSNSEGDKKLKKTPNLNNFSAFLRILLIILISIFLFFSIFSTIGACVGYFTNIVAPEHCIDDSFRKGQIRRLDFNTLQCEGENICFKYYMMTNSIEFYKNESKLFEKFSFPNLMMSLSIPIALEKVSKVSRHYGNGKQKMVVLIGGSIGVLCGYTIGEHIGRTLAIIENEKAVKKYVNKSSTKERFEYIMNDNNIKNNEK